MKYFRKSLNGSLYFRFLTARTLFSSCSRIRIKKIITSLEFTSAKIKQSLVRTRTSKESRIEKLSLLNRYRLNLYYTFRRATQQTAEKYFTISLWLCRIIRCSYFSHLYFQSRNEAETYAMQREEQRRKISCFDISKKGEG